MFDEMTLEKLQSELWDFYKDVHGVRPRHWTESEWASREFLIAQYNDLIAIVDAMTPEQKIAEGWGSDGSFDFPDHQDDGYALASAGWGTDEDYGSAEDTL
jgi:hypothetical protein